jgi:hypothetical protein
LREGHISMLSYLQQLIKTLGLSENLSLLGNTYQNIQISGNARVLLGNSIGQGRRGPFSMVLSD